jgi:hypothetical protein
MVGIDGECVARLRPELHDPAWNFDRGCVNEMPVEAEAAAVDFAALDDASVTRPSSWQFLAIRSSSRHRLPVQLFGGIRPLALGSVRRLRA